MTDLVFFKRGRVPKYKEREQVSFWIDSALYRELCSFAGGHGSTVTEALNCALASGLPVIRSNPSFISALKSKFEIQTTR